jgi:radical SAM superfamily enzyme YgiQ (UPF0313 family)
MRNKNSVVLLQDSVIYNAEMAILSGYLKSSGFKCRIVFEEIEGRGVIKRISEIDPDLIAIPTEIRPHNCISIGGIEAYNNIHKMLKTAKCPVVFFGKQASILPEYLVKRYPELHAVVIGDPEKPIEKILRGQELSTIPGIVFSNKNGEIIKGPVCQPLDLNSLPLPDFDSFYSHKGADRLGFYTSISRGCVYQCSFCQIGAAAGVYKPTKIRFYPKEWIFEGLEYLCSNYGPIQNIYMTDTNMTLNKKYAREFLRDYAQRIHIPFVAATRPDLITEDMAELLASAGCQKVNLGIECGIEDIRNNLLKKNLTNQQIINAVNFLKKNNIRPFGNVIIGLPGENFTNAFRSLMETLDFGVAGLNISLYQPLAGTPLADQTLSLGLIKEVELSGLRAKSDGRLSLSLEDAHKIENLSQIAPLMSKIKNRSFFHSLCKLPRNNFFMLIYHFPRLLLSLRYEYTEHSICQKFVFLFRNLWNILILGQRSYNR